MVKKQKPRTPYMYTPPRKPKVNKINPIIRSIPKKKPKRVMT